MRKYISGLFVIGLGIASSMPFVASATSALDDLTNLKTSVATILTQVQQLPSITQEDLQFKVSLLTTALDLQKQINLLISSANNSNYNYNQNNQANNQFLPSIALTAVNLRTNQSSDRELVIEQGDQIKVFGTPRNITGLAYNYTNDINAPGYSRAYGIDPLFNNLCGNNRAEEPVWEMTCTAKTLGYGQVSVKIYKDGQGYKSNTITIQVIPSQAPGKVTDLSAVQVGTSARIQLRWSRVTGALNGYDIYRSTSPEVRTNGFATTVITTGYGYGSDGALFSFDDTTPFEPCATYYYKIVPRGATHENVSSSNIAIISTIGTCGYGSNLSDTLISSVVTNVVDSLRTIPPSAKLTGAIQVAQGGQTPVTTWFEWGIDLNHLTATAKKTNNVSAGSFGFSSTLESLLPSRLYYVHAVAKVGTQDPIYGATQSFYTSNGR